MNTENKTKKISLLTPLAFVFIALGLLGGIIHILSVSFPVFADFINRTLGNALRFILSKMTGIFPFSVAEMLIYTSPLLVTVIILIALRYSKKGDVYFTRSIITVISALGAVYFLFAAGFAPGYRGSSLADKAGLTERKSTAEELYTTTLLVIDEVNGYADKTEYSLEGASYMPFTVSELSQELSVCYRTLSDEYSFVPSFSSQVKPIIISPLMTYTHISGIYSFFTGEANLNCNYPDFVNVFSAAHEMAHQRGFSREDEANFIAFLVLRKSNNDYLRYSASLNMYRYLSNALYSADYDLFEDAYSQLSANAKNELSAYSVFFDKYRDNTAADISDKINDAYLQSQGTEGTKSYGLVVDLAVSFYLD